MDRAKAARLQNVHRTLLIALVVLAIAVRLFFWVYTNRTWEDALISVQHSENAAAGLGLTHTPSDGPPLHGFTSPLSVLVPLAGELVHHTASAAIKAPRRRRLAVAPPSVNSICLAARK